MYKRLMISIVFLIGTMQYAAEQLSSEPNKSFFDNKFGGCELVLDPLLFEQMRTYKISYTTFERIMYGIMHDPYLWLPKDFVKRSVVDQKMYLEYNPESEKIVSTWYLYCDTGAMVTRCACASYQTGKWKIDCIR